MGETEVVQSASRFHPIIGIIVGAVAKWMTHDIAAFDTANLVLNLNPLPRKGILFPVKSSELQSVAVIEAGELLEQPIKIEYQGASLELRRIVLRLSKATRHGDTQIAILTNLPIAVASAMVVSGLHRERWQVEGLFLTITTNFEAEIETLAYPKAVLFSFSMALVTYNILATLRVALASVHGVDKVEAELSDFYAVDEIQGTYRGMMIAIPPDHWQAFRLLPLADLAAVLKELALQVNLKRFLKQPRKSETKTSPRVKDPNHPHVSTVRLLSRN